MGYIYKITNDINNKKYIGLTNLNNPIDRWTKHLRDAHNATLYSKRPLYEAMHKYGVEHFHFEIIEECENTAEREQYWIKKLRTYIGFKDCQGYNATLGGDGVFKNVFEKDEEEKICQMYEQGMSCTQIANKTNHAIDTISDLLRKNNYVIKNFFGKTVAQYDLENNFIQTFESANAAAAFLNKKGRGSHITEVCNGKRKIAYGYKWKYINIE